MLYRLAICDDDATVLPVISKMIRRECEKNGISAEVTCFDGGAALEAALREMPFDALFLDIDMPGKDGIQIADHLRSSGSAVCIVFLSAREDRVFDTFRSGPLRFVRKAHLQHDLPEAVKAVCRTICTGHRLKLPLSTPGGMVSVPVDEIMWAESFGKQQTLVTTGGTLEVKHTLKELCEKLAPHGFLQVHRCYVVSCRYIFSIESGRLIMDDRSEIPISRYRLADVKEAFRRSICHGLDAE
ncbi:MAG: response regulator transcription factor [Clostridia bacterium]|nr:response regulator transcription factor [Clostridia bacterium]